MINVQLLLFIWPVKISPKPLDIDSVAEQGRWNTKDNKLQIYFITVL